ncbi:MAG: pseudouridine synthase, partial [Patescibacteria group bacterium]|nr:pseudouridine synthase [Patescibacteria group bacterium]
LSEQFNSISKNEPYCKARKYYLAIVGPVSKAKIVSLGFYENKFVKVEGYIKRSRVDRQRFEFSRGLKESIKQNGARYCLSYVKIIREISPGVYLLEIMLVTGRTHQIRATLAGLGLPIRCDHVYGGAECNGVKGILLRSVRIDLVPPGVYRSLCIQERRSRHEGQDYSTMAQEQPSESLLGDCPRKDDSIRINQYIEQGIERLIVELRSSKWLRGLEIKNEM